jgi:hypothetical protein
MKRLLLRNRSDRPRGHQTSLWKAEAPRWLSVALDHMAQ